MFCEFSRQHQRRLSFKRMAKNPRLSIVSETILPPSYVNTYDVSDNPDYATLGGRTSIRQLSIGEEESYYAQHIRPMISTVQQAIIADALTTTGALWLLALTNVTASSGHGAPFSDQEDATHTIRGNYFQPYSTCLCIPDEILGLADSKPVAFPFLPNSNSPNVVTGNVTFHGLQNVITSQTIQHPNISRAELYNTSGNLSEYRLQWIDVPADLFNGSSIGAIIYLPRQKNNATQDILLCILAAGWGTDSLHMNTIAGRVSPVSSRITSGIDVPRQMFLYQKPTFLKQRVVMAPVHTSIFLTILKSSLISRRIGRTILTLPFHL